MTTKEIEVIDIDEPNDLVRAIDRIEVTRDPVILRRRGREVAIGRHLDPSSVGFGDQ